MTPSQAAHRKRAVGIGSIGRTTPWAILLAVLAFDAELQQGSTIYRAIDTVVLVGFTIGWVALAITTVGR
jgi:hypothetical protein